MLLGIINYYKEFHYIYLLHIYNFYIGVAFIVAGYNL